MQFAGSEFNQKKKTLCGLTQPKAKVSDSCLRVCAPPRHLQFPPAGDPLLPLCLEACSGLPLNGRPRLTKPPCSCRLVPPLKGRLERPVSRQQAPCSHFSVFKPLHLEFHPCSRRNSLHASRSKLPSLSAQLPLGAECPLKSLPISLTTLSWADSSMGLPDIPSQPLSWAPLSLVILPTVLRGHHDPYMLILLLALSRLQIQTSSDSLHAVPGVSQTLPTQHSQNKHRPLQTFCPLPGSPTG